MKVAILGAMQEEIEPFLSSAKHEPLLKYFNKYNEINYGKNIYYEAKYKDIEVVLGYSKIGKVNAALSAATMIERFDADILLFTGVAGAVKKELKIGDLIAATALCQHDLDISIFGHPYGFVPGGAVYVNTSLKLLKLAHKCAKKQGLKLQEGVIATGDQFVADSDKKEWIAKTFNADAIEMEGAAVAVICDALNTPFFVLRAISDAADMDARFDFDQFLKDSAKVSSKFVVSMLEEMANGNFE
jgi:adenosylhomocysteine/aminodeoxyfutalosine nucleosidase